MRSLSTEHLRLKAYTRQLIRQAGGLLAASMVVRVQRAVLSDYGNPSRPEHWMPLDVLCDLEKELGEPILSRLLVMCVEEASEPVEGDGDVLAMCARLAKEQGDFACVALKAAADGKLTIHELRALRDENRDIAAESQRIGDDLERLLAEAQTAPHVRPVAS